jgi:GT2 family glycosyltransferase
VEIVIPTRDRLELLTACLESITSLTTYPNYRITILDNDSRDADILAFFAATSHQVVPCPGPFNYAAIMNRGVAHTSAAFVVTLNNDTIVQTPDWLERMVAVAQLPEVGVVGTRQVDPDHGVVHAGVVLMPTPEHVRFADTSNYASMIGGMSRDVVAVTGACTMMRREVWDALGGLDETLRVVFNDIDLCLRSYELGYFTVYLDDVVLQHRESSSRGATVHHDDMGRFFARWDIFGSFRDPYAPAAMDLLDGQITAAFEIVPTNEQGFFYDKISES